MKGWDYNAAPKQPRAPRRKRNPDGTFKEHEQDLHDRDNVEGSAGDEGDAPDEDEVEEN